MKYSVTVKVDSILRVVIRYTTLLHVHGIFYSLHQKSTESEYNHLNADTALIVCLCLLYLWFFLSRSAPDFSKISTTTNYTRPLSEFSMLYDNTTRIYFFLAQFLPNKAMIQPRLFYNIKYWRSYRPQERLKCQSEWKQEYIFTILLYWML